MKKTAFNLLALAGLVAIMQTPVLAEQNPVSPCPQNFQNCPCPMHEHNPKEMQKRMKKHEAEFYQKLGLSASQKKQAEAIKAEEKAKMEPLRQEMNNLRKKVKAIRDEGRKNFEKILTPEQKTKLQQLQNEMKGRGPKNCPVPQSSVEHQ
jgi:Spy/CpxP family protein refolding chaperone